MKKLMTMMLAVGAMLGAGADDRNGVRLWENGPYWAKTNIGAEKPEDRGYYFWWGDTVGYKRVGDAWVATDGSSSNFEFKDDPISQQTYLKDNPTLQSEDWIVSQGGTYVLAPEHDAAQVQWGNGWRMPTIQELSDLNDKCDWTWTTLNGVNGYKVHGRGNYAANSIFLPAAGYGAWTLLLPDWAEDCVETIGAYWSSVPYSGNYSWSLGFSPSVHRTKNKYDDRREGLSIRPVNDSAKAAPEPPTPSAPDHVATGPRPTFVGSFDDGVASVWDGWTVSGGALGGVLQVKVSKSNGKKPAKVTATFIQAANGRKLSYKGEMDAVGGSTATLTFNGMTDFTFPIVVTLQFAENALKGAFGGDRVVGARNLFQSKDKQEAKAAEATLAPHLGAVNVVFGGGNLSLSVAKKGKVKVSGQLDDGTKVSATAQLIIGDEGLAIPVLVTKKADLSFLVWLSGGTATVEGLDGVTAAGAPQPKDSLTFKLGAGFEAVAGVQAELLPTAFAFGGGLKWSFKAADTVKLVDGAAAVTKDNGNPSGLKLTYKAKDGSFKGPFKVYAVEGGKLKKYTANVTGVMVGGKGYGTAEIKKPAVSATVTIE